MAPHPPTPTGPAISPSKLAMFWVRALFDFVTGSHDVAVVTQQDYDACSTAAPVDLYSTGPTAYSLDVLGNYYFICTKGSGASHYLSGQKLAITVPSSPISPFPSTSPPTRASATPPPPPKDNEGSPSLAANLSMIIFISMTMSFLGLLS
ncbi:hypothetical protein CRG98_027214 [Punica granatum]|uniref:Phytocyanin domain-containing protein n=1 Tax=Punica granatum TaxID=22663 RepID=A0A2I0J9M2_PUNGR|nr:hypothetical protein CRG98_027214 [Punica granatum]